MSGDGAKMEADWGDKTGRGFLETERDLCRLDSCCPPSSPCTGLLAAAVTGSGEVGVKAPSAGGPRVTAGPKDVVRVAGKDGGGDLTAICCTSHHCDSG